MSYISIFIKGLLMGAANVIPGVSGGTLAFIIGIYQRILDALKSFTPTNFKLLLSGKFKEFAASTDLLFLLILALGGVFGIKTLAKSLDYAFENNPIYIWSLFFGLIIASVWTVGKTIKKWNTATISLGLIGMLIAVTTSFLTPASENDNTLYLVLCGVFAVCSMITPGLSGSFVLLLMGNYHLIMLQSVNQLSSGDYSSGLKILAPVFFGAIIGLLAFANILSWLFAKHHDTAISLITGFIAGSTVMVWPWKVADKIATIDTGDEIKEKVLSYRYDMPDFSAGGTWLALGIMLFGVALVLVTERLSKKETD